ncbi:4-(cytidine 5'-diphospho)-2-C-methyl-D-erythritol kinase [uncultured Sphingomonas sp.]|uniref:4-(cytidine 5'-diphospho)-2-C-methyl-D-erythritol kinase n=1 Tax=uncultured Sphingomonas sp. TaxID=158754 RepID=UPI0025FAD592|nr:4-(cytidine 5'-diphospho)-2-C-methyl-D-erythritol kinase [uncultured Sphingomonas sp.]
MAGQVIVETAPAKLNLALHVRRRRDDGYHELETIFAFARDGDTVTVAPGEALLRITGPFADGLGNGPDNLVLRAEGAFKATFGIDASHAITLDKHLPIASGIGGGSADAAATLRALARLHGIAACDERLFSLAASLGADVPACLLGHAALGRGKGDALEKIAGLGDMPALLVNPGVGVSTAAVFARWDRHDRGALLDGDTLKRAIGSRNDLQLPAEQVAPVIAEVLRLLTQQAGVRLTRMSGSGATCFALFETLTARDAAALAIAAAQPDWWQLATTVR